MKILFFNPNTSDPITKRIEKEAKKHESKGLAIDIKRAPEGPEGIETYYDEVVSAYIAVKELKRMGSQYDGYIIGCFGDPGLLAARYMLDVPVVGLFEASLYSACLLGEHFSFVTSCGSEEKSIFIETTKRYGLRERLASVRNLGVGVTGVTEDIMEKAKEEAQKCVSEDGASVVIMGCAAFAGFGDSMTKELGFPVIDGVKHSIYFAKMMAEWSKSQSCNTKECAKYE